jgi:hypothetical protein
MHVYLRSRIQVSLLRRHIEHRQLIAQVLLARWIHVVVRMATALSAAMGAGVLICDGGQSPCLGVTNEVEVVLLHIAAFI